MGQSSFDVHRRRFLTDEEYEAGLRDIEKINTMRRKADLSIPENAAKLYHQLIGFSDLFEGYLGDEFLHQLQRCMMGERAGEWLKGNEPLTEKDFHLTPRENKARQDFKYKDKSFEILPEKDSKVKKEKIKEKRKRKKEKQSLKTDLDSISIDSINIDSINLNSRLKDDKIRPRHRNERETRTGSQQRNYIKDTDYKAKTTSVHNKKQKQSKKLTKRKKFAVLLIVLMSFVILYEVGDAIYYEVASYLSKKKIEELVSCILEPIDGIVSEKHKTMDKLASWQTQEESSELAQTGKILYKYSKLYERNSDMIGWICFKDTVINYPVMQTRQEEEYYLKRDFDKNSDINGLPFMDARNDITKPYNNWIIYGHNMKNGSMFSALLKYKDEEYFKEHKTFQFDTIYEEAEYEIMAVFLTRVAYQHEDIFRYYAHTDLSEKEEFEEYIENSLALSYYDTKVTAEYGDQLVTLSTCDRSIEDGRFVIVGKKIN